MESASILALTIVLSKLKASRHLCPIAAMDYCTTDEAAVILKLPRVHKAEAGMKTSMVTKL